MIYFCSDCPRIVGQFLCFVAIGWFAVVLLCYDALNRLGCLHTNWVVCSSTADAVGAVAVLSGSVVTLSADHCLLLLC